MRRKLEVFIVWSRDPLSRKVVAILVALLMQPGAKVHWDRVLKTSNPSSLPQWMANGIQNHVVICVVTPALAQWFAPGDDAPQDEHKGVRFEARQVMRRLYDHTPALGCPVIPVIVDGLSAELAPKVLQNLEISPFNHVTGEGIDIVYERVIEAHNHINLAHTQPALPDEQVSADRAGKVVEELLNVDAVTLSAPRLCQQWIRQAQTAGTPHSSEMLRIFKKIVRIAHVNGDISILRDATEVCLNAVEQLDLDDEIKPARATYLLHGKAFLLHHSHRVRAAQGAAEEALMLASDVGDTALAARAKRCLARIHRHLAEVTTGERQVEHLAKAREYVYEVMDHFRTVDDEKKQATLVLVEVLLTEFRLLRWRESFREASRLVKEAADFFTDRRYHEYYEVKLLQAAIALETDEFATASKVLDEILRDLRPRVERAEAFSELLGEGHLLRARLWVLQERAEAVDEIGTARLIFDKLGLQRKVAEADWLAFRHDRVRNGFLAYDIETLERLCSDPVERMETARRGRTWTALQGIWGRVGDRNWRLVIEVVRAQQRAQVP